MNNPSDYTYYLDRTDYSFGDNGYQVPIAKCARGTIFAGFTQGHLLELNPLSSLTVINEGTGVAAIDKMKCPGGFGPGHDPWLTLRPIDVPTVPLFIDDEDAGVVAGARIEGHEQATFLASGGQFPGIEWQYEPLNTGQSGYVRKDISERTNGSDSGVPRFVRLGDGSIAFLAVEATLGGQACNATSYRYGLRSLAVHDPSVTWAEVRSGRLFADYTEEPTEEEPEPIPEPEPKPVEIVHAFPKTIVLHYEDGTTKEYS